MSMLVNPHMWLAILVIGAVVLVLTAKFKKELLSNTGFAVAISLIIALAYFTIVDHYLMDMQGLDYWYLFRK